MARSYKDRKVVEAGNINKFLDYGIELVKITDITKFTSPNGNERSSFTFTLEGPEIEGFEGYENEEGVTAKGPIAWAKYGTWMNTDTEEDKVDNFIDNLFLIGEKAGFVDELYKVEDGTPLEEFLEVFKTAMKDKYFWVVIAQTVYDGKRGKQLADTPAGKNKRIILVKHKDFYTLGDKDKDKTNVIRSPKGKIITLKGINVVGDKVGVETTLEFNSEYHFEDLNQEKADSDPDIKTDPMDLGTATDGSQDLPF